MLLKVLLAVLTLLTTVKCSFFPSIPYRKPLEFPSPSPDRRFLLTDAMITFNKSLHQNLEGTWNSMIGDDGFNDGVIMKINISLFKSLIFETFLEKLRLTYVLFIIIGLL